MQLCTLDPQYPSPICSCTATLWVSSSSTGLEVWTRGVRKMFTKSASHFVRPTSQWACSASQAVSYPQRSALCLSGLKKCFFFSIPWPTAWLNFLVSLVIINFCWSHLIQCAIWRPWYSTDTLFSIEPCSIYLERLGGPLLPWPPWCVTHYWPPIWSPTDPIFDYTIVINISMIWICQEQLTVTNLILF